MSQFSKGQPVTQVLPEPVKGTVAGFSVDQETGVLQVQVEWIDADGHTHARYFKPDELQAA
jgi:hypothetical protein